MYVYVCEYVSIYIYVCGYIYVYIYMCVKKWHMYVYIYMYVCVNVGVYLYMCVNIYICVCIYIIYTFSCRFRDDLPRNPKGLVGCECVKGEKQIQGYRW